MHEAKFKEVTIVTAKKGCYLKLKDKKTYTAIIGKPIRIFFSNEGEIPELEEVSMNEEVEE